MAPTMLIGICLLAHASEELHLLYISTSSIVPSPQSSTSVAMEMAMAIATNLFLGSPSPILAMLSTPFTPPMSLHSPLVEETSS